MPLVLESYLEGVAESGWRGDLRLIRFACLAHLVLTWGGNITYGLQHIFRQSFTPEHRAELERQLEEYARRQELLLGRTAEEVRTLRAELIADGLLA